MKKYLLLFVLCLQSVALLQAKSTSQLDAEIKQLEDQKAILDQKAYDANEDADRLMTVDYFGSHTASEKADRYTQQAKELQMQIDALKKKRGPELKEAKE
jgi:hypothetical protein